tara:strand:+ start:1973 stop:2269 length:297 start_codon:yes stop_codon:yes gene_type:complete
MNTHRIDPNTIIFQTGNHYDEHGQVIVARLQPDGKILFCDLSRQIDGEVKTDLYSRQVYGAYASYDYTQGGAYSDIRALRAIGREHRPKVSNSKEGAK